MTMLANRVKQLVAGMDKVETGSRNKLALGSAFVLVSKVDSKETRKFVPFISVDGVVVKAINDGEGRAPGQEGYNGSLTGEECEFAFFSGDYFSQNFGPFLAAALNLSEAEAAAMTKAEIQDAVLSVVRTDETPVGILDGTTVVEVRTFLSAPMKDKKDETKMIQYTNNRFVRHVALSELAEVPEQDIIRMFGSLDQFATLVAAEG